MICYWISSILRPKALHAASGGAKMGAWDKQRLKAARGNVMKDMVLVLPMFLTYFVGYLLASMLLWTVLNQFTKNFKFRRGYNIEGTPQAGKDTNTGSASPRRNETSGARSLVANNEYLSVRRWAEYGASRRCHKSSRRTSGRADHGQQLLACRDLPPVWHRYVAALRRPQRSPLSDSY